MYIIYMFIFIYNIYGSYTIWTDSASHKNHRLTKCIQHLEQEIVSQMVGQNSPSDSSKIFLNSYKM